MKGESYVACEHVDFHFAREKRTEDELTCRRIGSSVHLSK
jgi:hypothetical protein